MLHSDSLNNVTREALNYLIPLQTTFLYPSFLSLHAEFSQLLGFITVIQAGAYSFKTASYDHITKINLYSHFNVKNHILFFNNKIPIFTNNNILNLLY
jgi:hypothetical protein